MKLDILKYIYPCHPVYGDSAKQYGAEDMKCLYLAKNGCEYYEYFLRTCPFADVKQSFRIGKQSIEKYLHDRGELLNDEN